jgi:hypothetical protein
MNALRVRRTVYVLAALAVFALAASAGWRPEVFDNLFQFLGF